MQSSFNSNVPLKQTRSYSLVAGLMAAISGVPFLRRRTRPSNYDATGKRVKRPKLNLGTVAVDRIDFTSTYPEVWGKRHVRRWRHR